MARKKAKRSKSRSTGTTGASAFGDPQPNRGPTVQPATDDFAGLDSDLGAGHTSELTGRQILTLKPGGDSKKVAGFLKKRGIKLAKAADYKETPLAPAAVESDGGLELEDLGVFVLGESDTVQAALAPATNQTDREAESMYWVEPEYRVYPICDNNMSSFGALPNNPTATGNVAGKAAAGFAASETGRAPSGDGSITLTPHQAGFLRGIQAVVNGILGANEFGESGELQAAATCFQDGDATWGLQVTGVADSPLTGQGVKVAILDTGFNFSHPDPGFASRVVASSSFVPNRTADDEHGHGTHVAGTACGPVATSGGNPRYGVATQAQILVARVLGPGGGSDSAVLIGINWAIQNGADIINMSLAPSRVCQATLHRHYEQVAKRALDKGVLLIGVAGNNSDRRARRICPVVGPGAAPSIVAVAAVDQCGGVANFSNQGAPTNNGAEINFAAPGVGVFSSWLSPANYHRDNGTSMAAPHVAGIAALISQETQLKGLPLYNEIRRRVRNIGGSRRDVGNGFVQV